MPWLDSALKEELLLPHIASYHHRSALRRSYWGKTDKRYLPQEEKIYSKLLSKTQVLNWLHFSRTQHPVPEGLKHRATDMCNISLCLGMALFSTGPKVCYLGRTDSIPCCTRCYLRSKTECIVGNASLGQLGWPAARPSSAHAPFSVKWRMHRRILWF